MINIEELRADIEAGTPGDITPSNTFYVWGISIGYCTKETPEVKANSQRLLRLPQLEREYLAMREALERAEGKIAILKVEIEKRDCLQDSAYQAGVKRGYQLHEDEDFDGFILATAGTEHIAEMKRLNSLISSMKGETQ